MPKFVLKRYIKKKRNASGIGFFLGMFCGFWGWGC